MLRSSGRIITVAILVFWGIMAGILLYREVWLPRQLSPALTTPITEPRDMWMGIYAADQERVGFINMRMLPTMKNGESGVRLYLTTRISVSMLGMPAQLGLNGEAWMHNQRGIESFHLNMESGDHHTRIEGEVVNGTLKAEMHVAGEVVPFSWPVGDGLQLSGGLNMPSLNMPLLEPGQEVQVQTFDPATMQLGTARLRHAGEETLEIEGEIFETVIVETTMSGMTTRAWVTRDEEVIQAETPFGLWLRIISPTEALAPYDPSDRPSFVEQLAVRVTGDLPEQEVDELRVRISGVDEALYPPADGRLQIRESENVFRFVRSAPPGAIPPEPLDEEEALARYLADDAFIPAQHERIREAARDIIGDREDPWERALALYEWAYENIEKVPVISVPVALDVLRTLEGDCNEHAVLYTALARAVDIPTRIAIGLVWSDAIGGFGYHAWPEVHVGHWIPMDPTLGEPIAGATHIKLLNGSIDQWVQLVPYLGQLELEVLSYE